MVCPSSQNKDKRQTEEWFNVLTISGFVNIESRMIHTVDIEGSRNHSASDHFLVINSSGEKNLAHSLIQLLSRDEGLDVQSARFVTRTGVELQSRGHLHDDDVGITGVATFRHIASFSSLDPAPNKREDHQRLGTINDRSQ